MDKPHGEPFESPEAFSLFGEPLHRSPIRLWLPSEEEAYREKMQELEENREKALHDYLADPDDPEKLLWLGRRTGILGRFNEAAVIYGEGIRRWSEDPRFYRFRGHRFAILRRIDLAINDFKRAAELIEGRPDEPELYASGGPSKDKMGVASFNWNVYYHQGFTYFAAGMLEEAAEAYRWCMEAADNLESRIATSHWLYMVLIRLGLRHEAEMLLEEVEPGLSLVEVGDYYQTLLMYKGHFTPEAVLDGARAEGLVRFITRAQAVGNLYLAEGRKREAVKMFMEVHATGQWTAGVHLLAEAELLRLGVTSRVPLETCPPP